jgi:hypothetical protein
MKAKHFLIVVEYDPAATRFLCHDGDFCEVLDHLARSAVECQTAGQVPAVIVIAAAEGYSFAGIKPT